MAFEFKELKRIVRFKAKDNDAVRYSEYDIREAANEALRYLSAELAASNADFLEAQRAYAESADDRERRAEWERKCFEEYEIRSPEDAPPMPPEMRSDYRVRGAELPEDFASIIACCAEFPHGGPMHVCESYRTPRHDEYKILDGRIYTGARSFTLTYRRRLKEVRRDEDLVGLPDAFKDSFAKLVMMILAGKPSDFMEEAAREAASALIPRRRYSNARIRMPFIV